MLRFTPPVELIDDEINQLEQKHRRREGHRDYIPSQPHHLLPLFRFRLHNNYTSIK